MPKMLVADGSFSCSCVKAEMHCVHVSYLGGDMIIGIRIFCFSMKNVCQIIQKKRKTCEPPVEKALRTFCNCLLVKLHDNINYYIFFNIQRN